MKTTTELYLERYRREATMLIQALAKVKNVHFCEPPPDVPCAMAIVRLERFKAGGNA